MRRRKWEREIGANTYETETSGRAGSSLSLGVSRMVVTLLGFVKLTLHDRREP